jgi:DNA-binding transcriptional regulator YiaG
MLEFAVLFGTLAATLFPWEEGRLFYSPFSV